MLEWLEVRLDVWVDKRLVSTALNRWIATEMRWTQEYRLTCITCSGT